MGIRSMIPCLKVCLALRFFATGANYKVIRYSQGLRSISTVSRCVNEMIHYLNGIYRQHIYFPKDEEAVVSASKFQEKFGIRGCVGVLDGTLIPIYRPIAD